MKTITSILTFSMILIFGVSGMAIGQESTDKGDKAVSEGDNGLMQRIDFGNSYIMGQTIQSGAVYLLQRKKSDIKSMLKAREDYREEILEGFNISSGEVESNGKNQR